MATLIQLRRGTAAAWTAANPVLNPGEIGVELETHALKVGDGVSAWSALSALSAGDVAAGDAATLASANAHSDAGITGLFSGATTGAIAVRSASGFSWLSDVAAGSVLVSGGVGAAPAWSTLTLPNAAVAGDVMIATGANAIGSLADVAAGSVLASGGVGAAPSWNATPTLTDLTLTGVLKPANGTANAPSVTFGTDTTTGLWHSGTSNVDISIAGARLFNFAAGATFNLTGSAATIALGNPPDVLLTRDAANTFAQRNGTSNQKLNIYSTFSDSSNYRRAELSAASTAFIINGTGAGTGAAGLDLLFQTLGIGRWQISAGSGHLSAFTDNTYDIGASGANRPRDIYAAGNVSAGGAVSSVGSIFPGVGGTKMTAQGNGTLTLWNTAGNDFGRLQFGGTTNAFPSLKRSGATLAVRLADDTADAGLTAASITTSSTTLHATSVALSNGAAVATGTLTNAPTAGNPTKWVPINDAGVTRYIPTW